MSINQLFNDDDYERGMMDEEITRDGNGFISNGISHPNTQLPTMSQESPRLRETQETQVSQEIQVSQLNERKRKRRITTQVTKPRTYTTEEGKALLKAKLPDHLKLNNSLVSFGYKYYLNRSRVRKEDVIKLLQVSSEVFFNKDLIIVEDPKSTVKENHIKETTINEEQHIENGAVFQQPLILQPLQQQQLFDQQQLINQYQYRQEQQQASPYEIPQSQQIEEYTIMNQLEDIKTEYAGKIRELDNQYYTEKRKLDNKYYTDKRELDRTYLDRIRKIDPNYGKTNMREQAQEQEQTREGVIQE